VGKFNKHPAVCLDCGGKRGAGHGPLVKTPRGWAAACGNNGRGRFNVSAAAQAANYSTRSEAPGGTP
jgi:hypothetical protein